ncbi:MAG: BolA/IbaG family iron-sulfur metabolism protein [Alphaproteobacteria bacterium]|nr:BolA/IbaG family iron-sulfur metabolism protein [Alphaproteobacteria bacterium]
MTLNSFSCIVGMKIFDTRLILKNSLESLEELLRDSLDIQFLELLDESDRHAGHVDVRDNPEALTHVCIRIQAVELTGLHRVAQHRMIYTIVQPAIDNGLHAIRFEIL